MLTASSLAISICLLVGAEPPAAIKPFQGKWVAEKLMIDGKDAPADAAKSFEVMFDGDKAIPAMDPKDVATIKVDDKKNPKEIDFTDKNSKINKGIYRFPDADTLELCMNLDEKGARPGEFASKEKSGHMMIVLKRKK